MPGGSCADTLTPMVCVYCGQVKTEPFTTEHVLPKALGGNLEPTNPFLVSVCKRCNTLCGVYVGRPFMQGFFTQADNVLASRSYVDLSRHPALPLWHWGPEDCLDMPDGRVCDFSIGPTGDHVYHFHYHHLPSTRWDDRDPGFVSLLIVAKNPAWHPAIVQPVTKAFPGATFYLGNGPTPTAPGFAEIPPDKENLVKRVRSLPTERTFKAAWDLADGDRFLAKLALGFGALFLAEDFPKSNPASLLRRVLWTPSPKEREALPLSGERFSPSDDDLAIDGGHVFLLQPTGGKLALRVYIYKQRGTVAVTADHRHWEDRVLPDGMVFIVIPGLRRYVGPVNLIDYLRWKRAGVPHDDLDRLKEEMDQLSVLPPFHLDVAVPTPSLDRLPDA